MARQFFVKFSTLMAVAVTLAGCAGGDNITPEGLADPLEPLNRTTHAVNKGLDTVILRPASQVYGVLPDPVENSIANASNNLGEPGNAVNHILQGDPGKALNTLGRFGVNSTVGIAGLFDPATDLGLVAETTDFGQTLHVWGAKEGAYVELPILGPSTARDATGTVVDFLLDPVNALVPSPEIDYVTGVRVVGVVDTRKRLASVIDQVLYESVDSYEASRRAYIENRRRTLGGEFDAESFTTEDVEDPFAFDP